MELVSGFVPESVQAKVYFDRRTQREPEAAERRSERVDLRTVFEVHEGVEQNQRR